MIRRLRPLLAVAALLPVPRASAEALVRDLGRGLSYVRVHQLPGDLPAALPPGVSATALDVRFVRGDNRAALVLSAWVRAHATRRTPLFLLTNGSTSAQLLTDLAAQPPPGLLFIGTASRTFTPDIVLTTARETERRAYDALEKGAAVASLLADNPGKPRVDEEMLEREHLSDSDLPDPESAPGGDSEEKTPPPLVDAAIQKAVQVDRGLLALRRL